MHSTDIDDFSKITLAAPDGAEAELYLHGGHITRWCPAGGCNRLFLSKRAEFRKNIAIRGGIPICFPQFAGEGSLPKHGFARLSQWTLLRTENTESSVQALLQLDSSAETYAIWPHEFRILLKITVGGPSLRLELTVQNIGSAPFNFTGALHTYLQVDDITRTVVENLEGIHYRDTATGAQDLIQEQPEICFTGEVDRIYRQAPSRIEVHEPERHMIVRSTGFPDVVIWNPGPLKCAALKDMEPMGYRHMVCVEAAAVNIPVEVQVGETWHGEQELLAQ